MLNQFELASASIIGKDHRRSGRNNQDAFHVLSTDNYLIAVVADGCGSGPHSEVGAQLGVRFATRIIAKELDRRGQGAYLWINHALASELTLLKRWLGDDPVQATLDYLLFTLVGVIITPDTAEFFAFGDGVIMVNGQLISIDYPGNAPPYPAYQILDGTQMPPEQLQFRVHRRIPTAELDSFGIGTDGVRDLVNATGQAIPGRAELIEPVEKLPVADRWYTNPDALRRYLTVVNGGINLRPNQGLLQDDTTFVIGRRKELPRA